MNPVKATSGMNGWRVYAAIFAVLAIAMPIIVGSLNAKGSKEALEYHSQRIEEIRQLADRNSCAIQEQERARAKVVNELNDKMTKLLVGQERIAAKMGVTLPE